MRYGDDNTQPWDRSQRPALLPKVEDLPEPIPDLHLRIAAEKAKRHDAQFKKAIDREFQKVRIA